MNPDFSYVDLRNEPLTNYELFLLPNGVYRVSGIEASNYLYPMYYFKDGDSYVVSTSVYALIHHKKRFIRNPRFQSTHFYRPTFMTIDKEIMRARTKARSSSREITEKGDIVPLAARLIQEYVTEIEEKYTGYVHIVLMGGKDSEAIILANRRARWVVISGEPNAELNREFIERNSLQIERFIPSSNDTDNKYLLEETVASDCFFDVSHSRWVRVVHDVVKEYDGKAVLWLGSAGDAILSYHHGFHRAVDYFAPHVLYVGMAMGILHQLFKNFLNIPVLSPYQSPRFLDELFYRFDPYFVVRDGDVRPELGELLMGGPVWYPPENPTPAPWKRNRAMSISCYVDQLIQDGIPCDTRPVSSWIVRQRERIVERIDRHSAKRRSPISRVLFPLRRQVSKVFPVFRNKRYDIGATEIK